MRIKIIKDYHGIRAGDKYECLMKMRDEDGELLWLVDYSMGARQARKEDVILYTSPDYDNERHLDGEYTWLQHRFVREVDLKSNREAVHLLEKE